MFKRNLLLIVLLLMGCSAEIQDYQYSSPQFNLRQYFNGNIVGWGAINRYDNKLTRRFCVEIDATWQGNSGVLDETFYFLDGEITKRVWRLSDLGDGRFSGQAGDVVGTASGKQIGMAFNWQYQLSVEIDKQALVFTMDDWMYQLDKHRVVNRTAMNKFGFNAANITLFFDKTVAACSNAPKR